MAALSLAGCRSVGDAPGLRGLGRLADLDVSGSPYVTGFSRPAVRQLARTLARMLSRALARAASASSARGRSGSRCRDGERGVEPRGPR